MITAEDRERFTRFAYDMGRARPDDPNPYQKNTPSWHAWREGREARFMGDFLKRRNNAQAR